jgi:hypothetical protein
MVDEQVINTLQNLVDFSIVQTLIKEVNAVGAFKNI